MHIQRFNPSRVLYIGPGLDSIEVVDALRKKQVEILSTRELIIKMFPDYFELDVPKKSREFRPIIDKAIDMAVAAAVLFTAAPKALVVSDRLSMTFSRSLTRPPQANEAGSLFLRCVTPEVIRERWPMSTLGIPHLTRWNDKLSTLAGQISGTIVPVPDSKSAILDFVSPSVDERTSRWVLTTPKL